MATAQALIFLNRDGFSSGHGAASILSPPYKQGPDPQMHRHNNAQRQRIAGTGPEKGAEPGRTRPSALGPG